MKEPRKLKTKVVLYLLVFFVPAAAVVAGWLYAYRELLFGR